MRVQLIAKFATGPTGTGRYAHNLYAGLHAAGVESRITTPVPVSTRLNRLALRFGLDARTFFASYPWRAPCGAADIYHLTSQTLATLLLFQRFKRPVVVSVLDILPHLLRHDPQRNTLAHPADALFYRLALRGLRRAHAWIAISEYTKTTLVQTLQLPPDKVQVVYPTLNVQLFRPQPVPATLRTKYGVGPTTRCLLYVGSDDPRKNLPVLIQALAQVKARLGAVHLIKVGAAHFGPARAKLRAQIASLGLQANVTFLENIPDPELVALYNLADALVFPSTQEGFGLPVAEAMACGTPVIAAHAASVPEIVSNLEPTVWPVTAETLAAAIERVLSDPRGQRLRPASVARAQAFGTEQVTPALVALYRQLGYAAALA